MTTIACDGKSMAADRLCRTSAGVAIAYRTKIRRLSDGRIVGLAGSAFDLEPVAQWLEAGGDPATVPKLWERTEFVVLMPSGDVRAYDETGRFLDGELLPTALGSGMEIAIGAMEAGKSPEEAVAIAIRRRGERGDVDVLRLDE